MKCLHLLCLSGLAGVTLAMITPAHAQQPYIGVTGYTLQSEYQFGTATGNNVRSITDLRANFKPNARWGRINGELQHYNNFLTTTYAGRAPDSTTTINRTHQFETEALVLNSNHLGGAYAWGNIESGAIVTNQTVYRPVIVEVLAQIPKGRAHWPAIWLYDLWSGNNSADEIDIMESVFNSNGDTRSHVYQFVHGTYTTVTNYLMDWRNRYNAGVDMSLGYHYYTTHWFANGDCDMYVDGARTIRRNIPWNAIGGQGGHPPNIEINQAITTDAAGGGWPGPIIANSGNGTDTFSPDSNSMFKIRHIRIFKPSGGTGTAAKCDMNGDGKRDILWFNPTIGANNVWLMNGTAYSSTVNLSAVSANWKMIGGADFNSDGKTDILWRNDVTGANTVWLMNGATLSSSVALASVPDLTWKMIGTGDFNSDGKSDVLWRNTSTGANTVWLMNGTTQTSSVSLIAVADLNWKMIGAGDFNSDGKSDILWRNYSTSANQVWLMNGTTQSSAVALGTVADLSWKMIGAGDFNSDGKPDIFWRHATSGANSLWLMNGTTWSSTVNLNAVTDLAWKMASGQGNN